MSCDSCCCCADKEIKTKITEDDVLKYIESTEVMKLGAKTTVVLATLKNGYELVASSSCVNADSYDEDKGYFYAFEKIKNSVYMLLGFELQTALSGAPKKYCS